MEYPVVTLEFIFSMHAVPADRFVTDFFVFRFCFAMIFYKKDGEALEDNSGCSVIEAESCQLHHCILATSGKTGKPR